MTTTTVTPTAMPAIVPDEVGGGSVISAKWINDVIYYYK